MENSNIIAKKRERSVNFTSSETRVLMNMVFKFQNIIENKKTDSVTNKEKDAAWIKIAELFNAASGVTARTPKTLKLKYESIKKTTKKKAAQNRQELYKTGGGEARKETFSAAEEKVLAICTNIDGLEARNDSDLIEGSTSALFIPAENEIDEEYLDDDLLEIEQKFPCTEEQIEGASSSKWETWTPRALKTKTNPALKTTKLTKANVKTKFDELGDSRMQLVELQMQVARNELKQKQIEHELHIQQKKEEHEVRMPYLHNEENRREIEHQLHMQKMKNNLMTK